MTISIRLVGARVENLRGYRDAELSFPTLRILVGENNEGKSSLLKMIHRLITEIDQEFWEGKRHLSESDMAFWMPANDTAGRARRLTLRLLITDGRTAPRYGVSKGDVVDLRFGILKNDSRARLNLGIPRRNEKHDQKALSLLELLKSNLNLILIPPIRDASTSEFSAVLTENVRNSLVERFTHQRQGGASREYRTAKRIIDSLDEIVTQSSEHLDIGGETVLSRMIRNSTVRLSAGTHDLLSWIIENIDVALSTGDHDNLMVSPNEVGNGLQSIMDLSLAIARGKADGTLAKDLLILVEEPEAFLHPSAQRELMTSIREHCDTNNCRMVLTTHSPIVLDESEFPEVAFVRGHKIFEPDENDLSRESINTNLLATNHAESFFADTVLLVEGPSDCSYFQVILRRLRKQNPTVEGLNKIHIQPVGGKASFTSWIQLLESYGKTDKPIEYLCLVDADALDSEGGRQSPVEKALLSHYRKISPDLERRVEKFVACDYDQITLRSRECKLVNELLADLHFRCLPIDLEWEVTSSLTHATRDKALPIFEIEQPFDDKLVARKLGSKVGSGKRSSGALKAAYVLPSIAQNCEKADIPANVVKTLDHLFNLWNRPKWRELNFQ